VKARAFASKSRYIAGYFDEKAVDYYFSELSKNDSVSFIAKKTTVKGEPETETLSNNDNTKLVMILSTNSDVVSNQIGNLAQNEQTLEMLARLANKEKIAENAKLNQELSDVYSQNDGIIKTGEKYIINLNTKDKGNVSLLLNYLNYIAAIKGYNYNFKTLNDAVKWLNEKK
jgi:hypothetical protein